MAGFFALNPLDFWAQFLISEIIGYLSTQPKEGMLMVIKVFREVKSFVIQLVENIIFSWEYLTY